MKRKLTAHNPIRHLRKCLNLTQVAFAKRYKLTGRQVQVMELAQFKVPPELASQWSLDYGVDADSMKRPIGFATMIGGRRATSELITAWKDIQIATQEDRKRISVQALSQLNAILEACSDEALPKVVTALGDAFETVVSSHRLKPGIESYLKQCATFSEPQRLSIAELNDLCSRSPVWKRISKSYSPNEIATVRDQRIPLWIKLGPAMASGFRCEMSVTVRKRKHTFDFFQLEGREIRPL